MNPTLLRDKGEIAEAYGDDPSWARSEYGAEFRSDPAELPREIAPFTIERVVVPNLDPSQFATAPPAAPAPAPRPRKPKKPREELSAPTPFFTVISNPVPGSADVGSVADIHERGARYTAVRALREKLNARQPGPDRRTLVYPVLKY